MTADQIAVVVGGCSGLGRVTAQHLSDQGMRVVVWDRSPASNGSLDETIAFQQVDVTDPSSLTSALEDFPYPDHPDILINSAGVAGRQIPMWEYTLDQWRHEIEVNLIGTFNVLHAVVPGMLKAGYGRVLNVASIAGKEGNANGSGYSASKGGVIALTKSVAKECIDHGVTVNAIAPAAFDTEIFTGLTDRRQELMEKIPMGRLGRPEEFAQMAAWIVSPENSFTTGFVFDISGGRATY